MAHNNESINPACDACLGACCESFVLPAPTDPEALVWITLRGRQEGRTIRFDLACKHLECGKCGIEPVKPLACRIYPVGGPECIAAIRDRRPKNAAQLIRLARNNQTT